jgi:hypothetical protein
MPRGKEFPHLVVVPIVFVFLVVLISGSVGWVFGLKAGIQTMGWFVALTLIVVGGLQCWLDRLMVGFDEEEPQWTTNNATGLKYRYDGSPLNKEPFPYRRLPVPVLGVIFLAGLILQAGGVF